MEELELESPTLLSEIEVTDLCHAIHEIQEKVESKIVEKIGIQLARMESCSNSFQQVVVSHVQALRKKRQECEKWKRMTEELSNKLRKLQDKLAKEKQERKEEKEWLLSVWPDGVVLPTILQQFEIPQKTTTFVKDVQNESEKKRMQALINRRTSRNEVLHHMETATHWKIVSEPDPTSNGALQTFYHNTNTGESVWEAPTAMFYKPPLEWDEEKMDWKDSYGVEHFYPKDPTEQQVKEKEEMNESSFIVKDKDEDKDEDKDVDKDVDKDEDNDEDEDDESGEEIDTFADTDDSNNDKENEEEEEEEEFVDPSVFRELLTKEIEHTKELESQLEKSKSQQRAFALQLLNATRDSFEKEKEQLAVEDEAKKQAERKKRKQEQEEKLAIEAAAAAASLRKQKIDALESESGGGNPKSTSIVAAAQRRITVDSVGKKDMVLTKEEELFEAEIEEFVLQQRADRFYLAAPISKNPKVRMHQTFDEEYVHMKHIDTLTSQLEQIEFDLIEKTTTFQENAHTKINALKEKQLEIHETLFMIEEDHRGLTEQLSILEIPIPKPTTTTTSTTTTSSSSALFRNSSSNAFVNYDVILPTTNNTSAREIADGTKKQLHFRASNLSAAAASTSSSSSCDVEKEKDDVNQEEKEEKKWKTWELKEVKRVEMFERTQERIFCLEALMEYYEEFERTLIENELIFFNQLVLCEKEISTKLFDLQANSQVERARFSMERTTREENLFFLKQQLEQNANAIQKASCLPRQALNPLDKIHLQKQSTMEISKLNKEKNIFFKKMEKEKKAQKQLICLEKRFFLYVITKLQEEQKLMNEKQILWKLNIEKTNEMEKKKLQIQEFYQETYKKDQDQEEEEEETEENNNVEKLLLEEAKSFFNVQLNHVQEIRKFLFLCYERERRWREIASSTLIEVTSTDQWMTKQQKKRHFFQMNQLKKFFLIQKKKYKQKEIHYRKKLLFFQKQLFFLKEKKQKNIILQYQKTQDFLRKQSFFLLETLQKKMNDLETKTKNKIDFFEKKINFLQEEKNLLRQKTNEKFFVLEQEQKTNIWLIQSLKQETQKQQVLNDQLLQSLNAMQKQKAMEINDLKYRVFEQIKKIHLLELWTQSLQLQLKEKNHDMFLFQQKIHFQKEQQKFQQKQIRLHNWKQRITIQSILMDTNCLFDFFCESLTSILCGANEKENKKIRENGGIDVLATLCQFSKRLHIQNMAAKALGKVAWNANISLRCMGWKAKKKWFEWVEKMSTKIIDNQFQDIQTFDQHLTITNTIDTTDSVTTTTATSILDLGTTSSTVVNNNNNKKRSLNPIDSTKFSTTSTSVVSSDDENCSQLANVSMNHHNVPHDEKEEKKTFLAEISRVGGAFLGEFDQDELIKIKKDKDLLRKMMQKTWKKISTFDKPNGNEANQEYIGLASNVMKVLLELCRHGHNGNQKQQQQLHHHPIEIIRASKEDFSLIIQRNALLSLAMIVMNTRNTTVIGKMEGSIELLVGFLKPLPFTSSSIEPGRIAMAREDLEIVRYAIHAIANLAYQNPYNQQKIAKNHAISWLLELISFQKDTDLIYAATLALSHLTHKNVFICEEIFAFKGIDILLETFESTHIFDLIELNQFELIQKNIAEILANVIVNLEENNIVPRLLEMQSQQQIFHEKNEKNEKNSSILSSFVLMCASLNRDVMFHGALILGSLAQNDDMRSLIGNSGGVDALFLLASLQGEEEIQSQATWALANLTWNRENQYRIARYIHQLYQLCMLPSKDTSTIDRTTTGHDYDHTINKLRGEIREHALCILANSLFYNEANRLLVVHEEKIMDLLKANCLQSVDFFKQPQQSNSFIGSAVSVASLEHSARALCALSYHDEIALEMGARGFLQVFLALCTYEKNHLVQKNGLYGIINLCLHDINKTRMIEIQESVNILVKLSGGESQEIRIAAIEALDLLADIRQMKQDESASSLLLASARASANGGGEHADMKKLLALCDSNNASIVAMALDAISDEVWKKPSAKVKVRNEKGLEKLLQVCIQYSTQASTVKSSSQMEAEAQKKVILGSLWAMRNSISDNTRNQDFFGAYHGIKYLIQVHDQHRHDDDIIEAILATLIAVCKNNPRNSQELLQIGLDVLITIAEGSKNTSEEERREQVARNKNDVMATAKPTSRGGHEGLENSTLAAELLHCIAPHNTTTVETASVSPIHSSPRNSSEKRKLSFASTSPKRNGQGLPSPAVHHT